MIIGSVEIDLNLPGVNSLKEKRKIVKSLTTRIRNKFNVSIAEVDFNDRHRSARIGAAIVTNDRKFADQVIAGVVSMIESNPEINLVDYQVEII